MIAANLSAVLDGPPESPSDARSPHLRDRLLRLSDLAALPPVRPLIDGLLYRDTLAQMAGAPGSYKSFLALGMACSVAAGVSFEGHRVTHPGTVVYVVAEGASGMHARTLAWCQSQRMDPRQLEERLLFLPLPIQLGDVVDVSEAVELASEHDADLVVLDTRARCTLGLDENSSTEQGRAIAAAERIQQASGATVLLVHHAGRSGDHGRGSNAWDGAVWSDLRVTGDELRAKVTCAKHKDVPDGCDHHFRMVPVLVEEDRLPRLEEETEREWEQRRSTLTVVQNDGRTTDPDDPKSVRVVLDIFRTSAGLEGLTRSQAVELAMEAGIARSSAFDAVKVLVSRADLRNIGTAKRARYVPSTDPLLGGDDR